MRAHPFPPTLLNLPLPRPSLIWVFLLLSLGALVALAPWPFLLVATVGSLALVLSLRAPWLPWVGLAFLLPLAAGQRLGPATFVEPLLLAALGIWAAAGVAHRRLELSAKLPLWPLGIFLLALYTSTLGAADLTEAATEVLKWVEAGLILWILPNAVPPHAVHWIAAALLLAAVVQAGWGLYQFFWRIGPDWFLIQGRFMRASGFFRQPNPYGGFLGLMLPVAASLTLWAWFRLARPGVRWTGLLLLALLAAATLLIGAGLVASWSRGAWLGAVAALLTVLAFWNRTTLTALVAATGAGGVAGLLGALNPAWIPAALTSRLGDLPAYLGLVDILRQEVNDDNFAVIERVAHWVAALRMWAQAPWLGVGPGNYAWVYPQVALPRWPDPLGHAHNIYLNLLAETGLIGLITHLLVWAALLFWLIQVILRMPGASRSRALGVGVLGMVAHLAVHSVFDNLYVQGMYLVLAFWFALVAAAITAPSQSAELAVRSGRNVPESEA